MDIFSDGQVNRWTDGLLVKWTDRQMDRCLIDCNRQIYIWAFRQMNSLTNGQISRGQMDRWEGKQVGKWTDGRWIDRQADRQMGIHRSSV
jgi:hypothetical protein